MKIYFDAAILLKLYLKEVNSEAVIDLVTPYGGPLIFTHLHENEIKNAMRLKLGRQEITQIELQKALENLQKDITDGKFERPDLHWPDVYRKAEKLSQAHAVSTLCRTLDTLHVASALTLGSPIFGSLDKRQRILAQNAGLELKP